MRSDPNRTMIKTTTELMQTLRLECHVGGEWMTVPLQGGGGGRWSGQLEQIPGALEALLHRLTGREEYLVALGEGAEYEYLWRYGFRARPEAPPLKGSGWNSCGASGTSVSNAHLHPIALIVAGEFAYLAEKTGDTYHRDRLADVVQWALNSIELYPEVMGYGRLGVMSERYCPSDGLLEERYPDGTPASTWFSYNGWGAASVLEGLISSQQEIRS